MRLATAAQAEVAPRHSRTLVAFGGFYWLLLVIAGLVLGNRPARAEGTSKDVSPEVAALLYGESFISTSGQESASLGDSLLDMLGAGDSVGISTEFRRGTFKGASRTAGQVIRRSSFSGLAGSELAFKMTSIEASLVPFTTYGDSGTFGFPTPTAGGSALDGIAASLVSPQMMGSIPEGDAPRQPGLSFHHDLSSSPAPDFDAAHGLQFRQFDLAGKQFAAGFGRLNVGQIDSPELLKDVTDTVNKSFSARAALGAANKTLVNLKDLKSLKDVEQEDGYLSFKPTKSMTLATEFNRILTPDGEAILRDYRFDYGKLSITGAERNLDHTLSDAVLKGLGRDDLVALKGTEAREWTALLPLFADEKGNPRLSFTHFRKDELVDKSGNITTATESHTRRNSLVLKPLSSSTLEFTNEVIEAGNVERPDGLGLDQTLNRTYKWTQKLADHTTTTLTHTLNMTDYADENVEDVRSEALSLHIDTKPWRNWSVIGDWNQVDHSRDGETNETKLKVTAPINKALTFTSDFQDKYTDLNGVEDRQSYTLSYLWNKKNKLSFTTQVSQSGKEEALKTTSSNTLSLTPWENTTLDWTQSKTEDPTSPSSSQKVTVRQKMFDYLTVVARQEDCWTPDHGEETIRTYYFDWTKEKSPFSIQVGFETLDTDQKPSGEDSAEQTTVDEDQPALYCKLTATPAESLSLSGSYARRRDLTEEPLELWDWKFAKSFGSKWSLTASQFYNKPSSDMLTDSVLPFSKTYQPIEEQSYALGFPVSYLPLVDNSFSGNLGYTKREDRGAATVSGEIFFALNKAPSADNKLSLKVARGIGTSGGEIDDYFTYSLSFGVNIGSANEFSVDARYTDDETFAPSAEGKLKLDLTFRRLF